MTLLYKRPGSPFWYVTKTRQSTKTVNRQLAEKFAKKALNDHWHKEALGEKVRTWAELCADWLDTKSHKKSIDRDATTIDDVTAHLSAELDLPAPAITLADVDGDVIRSYGKAVKARASGATANRHLAIIRAMLRQAEVYNWIVKAPAVKQYPVAQRTARWLTPEEFNTVAAECVPWVRDLAVLAVQTGMRFANVRGLRWEWITNNVVIVPASETKTGQMYTVPLSKLALEVVSRIRATSPDPVFVLDQNSYDAYRYEWTKAVKRAGVARTRLHDLRHTFASWHCMAGTPDRVLAAMGGWKGTAMLTRYAHLSTKHLTDYADNLNKNS